MEMTYLKSTHEIKDEKHIHKQIKQPSDLPTVPSNQGISINSGVNYWHQAHMDKDNFFHSRLVFLEIFNSMTMCYTCLRPSK